MANFLLALIVGIFFWFNHANAYAQETYFTSHATGWHWYNDPKDEDESEEDADSDPTVQMNAVHATVMRALNKAYLNPTKENIKHYKEIQDQVTNRASEFSKTWQTVVLENPELNYSLQHPTNNLAKQVEQDQAHANEEKVIREFARHYQLYFFYKSTCPYCQRFAPILKNFAENYGFNVLPITTDGISLPEFPGSYVDQGESRIYNVTVEPTLFAVNPMTHQGMRIATGLTSQEELKQNIMLILNTNGGNSNEEK